MKNVVIVSAARTPIGSFNGALSSVSATRLGSMAIIEALKRIELSGEKVDEVFMGNVLSAGLGQAPARQAALGAGLPQAVGCTTVNKVCGSGMKAAMIGHDLIAAGSTARAPAIAWAMAACSTTCSSMGSRTPMTAAG